MGLSPRADQPDLDVSFGAHAEALTRKATLLAYGIFGLLAELGEGYRPPNAAQEWEPLHRLARDVMRGAEQLRWMTGDKVLMTSRWTASRGDLGGRANGNG